MLPTAIFALILLVAGVLAVLGIGGAIADAAGLAAVVIALMVFCRAVVRLAEGRPPLERDPDGRRSR